jgi:hypothetical protein
MTLAELAAVPSHPLPPVPDQVRLAVAACLACFKGSSREHTESAGRVAHPGPGAPPPCRPPDLLVESVHGDARPRTRPHRAQFQIARYPSGPAPLAVSQRQATRLALIIGSAIFTQASTMTNTGMQGMSYCPGRIPPRASHKLVRATITTKTSRTWTASAWVLGHHLEADAAGLGRSEPGGTRAVRAR